MSQPSLHGPAFTQEGFAHIVFSHEGTQDYKAADADGNLIDGPLTLYSCFGDMSTCCYVTWCGGCAFGGTLERAGVGGAKTAVCNLLVSQICPVVCCRPPCPVGSVCCAGCCWASCCCLRRSFPEYLQGYHATFRRQYDLKQDPGACSAGFCLPALQCWLYNCVCCGLVNNTQDGQEFAFNEDLYITVCPCTASCEMCRMARHVKAMGVIDVEGNKGEYEGEKRFDGAPGGVSTWGGPQGAPPPPPPGTTAVKEQM